jgi:hypothetical protein
VRVPCVVAVAPPTAPRVGGAVRRRVSAVSTAPRHTDDATDRGCHRGASTVLTTPQTRPLAPTRWVSHRVPISPARHVSAASPTSLHARGMRCPCAIHCLYTLAHARFLTPSPEAAGRPRHRSPLDVKLRSASRLTRSTSYLTRSFHVTRASPGNG